MCKKIQLNKLTGIENCYSFIDYEGAKRLKFFYIGHFDDIQTVLKPLKKSEKIEINLYGHFLGLD